MPAHRIEATFASLRNRNFRRYFAAQIASNIGNWMQITAKNWLVLQLTHSGLAPGITNALQFGPLLCFGLYGGVVADRFERRRLLMVPQGLLTVIAIWAVFIVAYNLQVMVPLLASRMLGRSSELYGIAMSALGLGAV